jgi:hypothetical protein
MGVELNYLAILVCAVVGMMIGMMWYGPLFGKPWMAMMGIKDPEAAKKEAQKKGMGPTYAMAFVSQLLMAYVVAHFVAFLKIADVNAALQFAFWAWLGLIATVLSAQVLWEGRPAKFYYLNATHYLVVLSVMTLILAYWK